MEIRPVMLPVGPERTIRAALGARGLRVGRLEQIQPSLEDVFVALTAAHEPKAGRPA